MYNKSATLILAALPVKNHLEPASVLVCCQSVKGDGVKQSYLSHNFNVAVTFKEAPVEAHVLYLCTKENHI